MPASMLSARGRRRAVQRDLVNELVALQVGSLSFQHLGRPTVAPAAARTGAAHSPAQLRMLKRLKKKTARLVRSISGVHLDASCGRKASSTLMHIKDLGVRLLGGVYSEPARQLPKRGPPPLDLERVALPPPGHAGSFDPSPYLRDDVRNAFEDPGVLAVEPSEAARPCRAPHHVRPGDRVHLLERLDEAGMLDFAFACDTDTVAGMFPVDKGDGKQRLITNRRPRNAHERSIGAVAGLFPHGSVLTDIQLPDGHVLRGSGDDLPDFYHSVRVPGKRALTNAFGPAIAFREVQHLHAASQFRERFVDSVHPGTLVRALQTTLPMGDVNATDFAQLAHLGVLAEGDALSRPGLVSYRSPPPASFPWQLVMVDDHIVVHCEPPNNSTPDAELLQRAESAYEAAGLTPKPNKSFRHLTSFEALGAAVDGISGWVSAKPKLLLVALALSVGLIGAQGFTGSLLATTSACWTQVLLYRRAGFCLLDRIFESISRAGPTSSSWHLLPPSVIDELLLVSINLPSWGADLRADVREELFCTDASGGASAGIGGCYTKVPRSVAQELWRHKARKGGYVRKDSNATAVARGLAAHLNIDFDADEHLPDARWFGDVCDALGWIPAFSYRSLGPRRHINLLEIQGARSLVRRLARSSTTPCRQLCGLDSNVAVGALAKGRSSSRDVNRLLRSFLGEQLLGDIYIGTLPVGSQQNPADAPSRRRAVRRLPVDGAPAWAQRFVQGDPLALVDCLLEDDRWTWLRLGGHRGERVGEAANPGPRSERPCRDLSVDLRERPSLTDATRVRRSAILERFSIFLEEQSLSLEFTLAQGVDFAVSQLRDFGQHHYVTGGSLTDFKELINAIVSAKRGWRSLVAGAWDIVSEWQHKEPVTHHVPLPKPVARALLSLALLRHDTAFAILVAVGFFGGLRPGELYQLTRGDLVLPQDLGYRPSDAALVFVVIRDPRKSRRAGVHAQHVTIDDPTIVRFLVWAAGELPCLSPLWTRGPYQFRATWDRYCILIGLPVSGPTAFTPASLRAGCATELFLQEGRDPHPVQWHLRHKDASSLTHYIQELPAALARASLSRGQQRTVQRLSAFTNLLFERTIQGEEGKPLGRQ